MRPRPCATVVAATLALGWAIAAADPQPEPVTVPTEQILAAMREVQGYALTATANGPRLQAEVLLKLIHEAEARDSGRRPLFVGHREWYQAFLARTNLPPSRAPLYVRLPYEVGQDLLVDYRTETVVQTVVTGPRPQRAANVWIYWPPGGRDRYSYDDTLSKPNLRVTQRRLISYRLIEYEDRLWYAEVSGLHGRPTSGPLGLLFDLIGEAKVEESRSAFIRDGVQVVRGRARKWWIEKTETVTIWPDGHAERGVPADRHDLRALEARLREPLAVRFAPLPPPP